MSARAIAAVVMLASPVLAAESPRVEHQPIPCTVPGKPLSLCASITDDRQVAKARVYFRASGEKFYNFVEMAFGGINFCGTLPAPREGKVTAIEYYVQGVDDEYDAQRTSTYQMNVLPEAMCEFPPLEKDPARVASIVVHATSPRQGKKLDDAFASAGVSFVPMAKR
ncbi:MAG TPA: hypothetical protein VIG50_08560 [Vicinamibacteria bacterium]